MSEWLGKSRIEKEDLDKDFPSLTKYFPMLARFYIENQRMRIVLPLEYDMAERFKAVLKKKYGKITPVTVREATLEAISNWIEKSS
jgi:hypothetical protein